MDVSIIIVNYNTKQLTKACIDSIIEYTTEVTYEIILVDNASTDGSVEMFSRDTNIRFLPQSQNLGFGKANNIGIQVAKGRYVFLLNSDTYLCNNALKLFFDFCEGNHDKKIGAVGCLLNGKDLKRTHSFADFPKISKVLFSRLVNPLYKLFGNTYNTLDNDSLIKDSPFKVDYVTGADIFIRKSLLDKYGAFDPEFFMYFEETEMQHRLTKAGYPSYILPAPEIVHLEGSSIKKTNKRNIRKMMMVQRSQFLYFKKTASRFSYILFRIMFFFMRIPFILFAALTKQEKKDYLRLLISKI